MLICRSQLRRRQLTVVLVITGFLLCYFKGSHFITQLGMTWANKTQMKFQLEITNRVGKFIKSLKLILCSRNLLVYCLIKISEVLEIGQWLVITVVQSNLLCEIWRRINWEFGVTHYSCCCPWANTLHHCFQIFYFKKYFLEMIFFTHYILLPMC